MHDFSYSTPSYIAGIIFILVKNKMYHCSNEIYMDNSSHAHKSHATPVNPRISYTNAIFERMIITIHTNTKRKKK